MKVTKILLISAIATFAMAAENNATVALKTESNATMSVKMEGVKYIKMLGMELKGKMKKAMKADPTALKAVKFCSDEAEKLTQEVNAKFPKNVTVKRVSLDVRNPKNSPDTIDTKVLNEYAKAIENKTFNPKDIKVVQDGNTTRVYKPMVVGKVCLKCHGSNVSKEVKEVIAKKYPADKAINLKEGTLRGAFVAEIKK